MATDTIFTHRRTVNMTEKASDNLKQFSKEMGVSQFTLMSALLESMDPKSPTLLKNIKEIDKSKQEGKARAKELKKKLKDVSPEDLQKALEAIGKA